MSGGAAAARREGPPIDFVRGDTTGLAIPAHGAALRAAGADFLTEAFRAFGAIGPDNAVARITRIETCPGGSTGEKLFLSVEYARPDPAFHTDLFVKFSRDFADPVRDDRGKYEMAGEVRLAEVSRLAGFPIHVPIAYFADYQAETHTGLLITETIGFGANGIEPHHPKCLDNEIDRPIDHYRAIYTALARVAAAHRSGQLPCDIDALFPFDPVAASSSVRIGYDAEQLIGKVRAFAAFVARAPQLFPPNLTPAFFEKLEGEALGYLEHQAEIRRFTQSDPSLIALCHWNGNIDNCWFWRDAAGDLQCGLMDWGHAGQINLAFSLWGCLSGAGLDVWDGHFDELIDLFVTELREHGGPALDRDELVFHLELYVAMMGLSYFIDSPARILGRMPDAADVPSPFDPIFRDYEMPRNQLHISRAGFNLWQRRDFGATLDRFVKRMAAA
ncbi:hypothetical protein PQ455_01790 [Sphingomonas naphthae]|uniref:Aminoglycoside phosphotransferase domain-containing protein n=1 Tax=Sphingomonas naphthae TaxID=1813468 RepID=A0ABY7TMS9_9SPHN|nr:hypothetical protein [Sphingomonas naphthae]WCT73992.1 hypothetical protein PQ455_01790 [Sphingomonas naphthae]